MNGALNEVILSAGGVALDVIIFALPIYYVWKLVTSFRREGIPHWPPILALSLWLLQWPFAIVSAVDCLGGGCAGDPVRNGLELLGILPYRPTKNCCNSKTERKPGPRSGTSGRSTASSDC